MSVFDRISAGPVAPDLAISIVTALSLALWLSVGLGLVVLRSWFGW